VFKFNYPLILSIEWDKAMGKEADITRKESGPRWLRAIAQLFIRLAFGQEPQKTR